MKGLLYDTETYPYLGYFWGDRLYEQDIIEVKEQGGLLGFGYVWAHLPNKVHWVGLPDSPGYKKGSLNDKWVAEQLFKLIGEADYYIAHNGKSFDNKVANTAFLKHGLGPPDNPKAYDTKQIFKSIFRLPSNKLDEIGRELSIGRKTPHTGKKLWFDCMAGDPKAWKLMEEYCKQDVLLLQEIWETVKPWIPNPPNWNLDADRPACCPSCGGARFKTTQVEWYTRWGRQKYRCLNPECRHIWRGEIVERISMNHWVDKKARK